MQEHVSEHGYQLVDLVSDTASGASLERPGIARIREAVRAGEAEVVVAFSLDRLSRSQNHVGLLDDECQRHGVRLEFATEAFEDTPVGRFIRSARAFTDEIEREKIRERTMRGKLRRMQEGRLAQGTGSGIFGYVHAMVRTGGDGRRHVHPDQAVIVRHIFEEFVAGRSVLAIADSFNSEAVPTQRAWDHPEALTEWHPLTVRRILINDAYIGRTVYGRTTNDAKRGARNGKKPPRRVATSEDTWIEIPNATPRIIDDETWAKAQLRLSDPARQRRGRPKYHYALTGRIRCSACETPLAGSALSGGKGRNRIRYYTCRKRYGPRRGEQRCSASYIRAEDLERRVIDAVKNIIAEPMAVVSAYNHLLAEAPARPDDGDALRDRVAELDGQLRRLTRLARFAENDAATDAVGEELRAVSRAKSTAVAELAAIKAKSSVGPFNVGPDALAELSGPVADWLDSNDVEKVKLALEGLDITIWAGEGEPSGSGTLPLRATYQEIIHPDVCSMVT